MSAIIAGIWVAFFLSMPEMPLRTGEQYRYANAVEARAEAMLAVNHGVVGLLYCEATGRQLCNCAAARAGDPAPAPDLHHSRPRTPTRLSLRASAAADPGSAHPATDLLLVLQSSRARAA